jgi:hypothetical protein
VEKKFWFALDLVLLALFAQGTFAEFKASSHNSFRSITGVMMLIGLLVFSVKVCLQLRKFRR